MLIQNLIPSPALSIAQFSDIDAFRPVEFRRGRAQRPVEPRQFPHRARDRAPPFCQITALTSFARIVDVSYRVAHGVVILQLEDDYEVSANGMSVNGPAFVGMRGNVDCQFFEPRGSLHAIIVLGAGLRDREWFETPDQLCAFTPDMSALAAVRSVVTGILQTASAEPHLMKEPGFALALQETLLLAVDDMFRRSRKSEISGRIAEQELLPPGAHDRRICRLSCRLADLQRRPRRTMRRIGQNVGHGSRERSWHEPTSLLASQAALVGPRTTRERVRRDHRDVVRTRVNGFHHMGEFARLYRAAFHEPASRTLARAREID